MKNEEEILCLSWCDADDVMNYGQILQGCAMMYILRQLTDGVIRYVSFFPRGLKRKVKYLLKHYNPFSGHLFAYLRSKRIIDSFIHQECLINREGTLCLTAEGLGAFWFSLLNDAYY